MRLVIGVVVVVSVELVYIEIIEGTTAKQDSAKRIGMRITRHLLQHYINDHIW